MTAQGMDRRLYPRRSLRTKIIFQDEYGNGLFYVYSKDVSMGGVFLDAMIPLKVGTMLFLSFSVPTAKQMVRVTGQVVRRLPSAGDGQGGMGIRFLGLSQKARAILEAFLLAPSDQDDSFPR